MATFLLFFRLAAAAPVGSEEAAWFLVGALRAIAGVNLGVFTLTVSSALLNADFSPAFLRPVSHRACLLTSFHFPYSARWLTLSSISTVWRSSMLFC